MVERIVLGTWEAYGLMGVLGLSGWGVAWVLWKRLCALQDAYPKQVELLTGVVVSNTEALNAGEQVTKANTDAFKEMSAEYRASRKLLTQVRRG